VFCWAQRFTIDPFFRVIMPKRRSRARAAPAAADTNSGAGDRKRARLPERAASASASSDERGALDAKHSEKKQPGGSNSAGGKKLSPDEPITLTPAIASAKAATLNLSLVPDSAGSNSDSDSERGSSPKHRFRRANFANNPNPEIGAEAENGASAEGDVWDLPGTLRGVVKVFCTTTKPNYRMPWQMDAQRTYTGSGCLMPGRKVLTNAHVVGYGTTITLLKHGDPKRYLAKIASMGHEYDLAMLEVVDDEADAFWSGTQPLELGDLPPLNSTVMLLGYPTDIDSVSVTEGVVSRVMVDVYRHSNEELLKLQVDAAINPGNSGGPAIVDGKLIGIVSEVQKRAQNIGFAIPAPVVNHFLSQTAKANVKNPGDKYPGICVLGISWLGCDNGSFRSAHRLGKNEHGIAVSNVLPLSVCKGKVLPGDVLMAIDGCAIANDGTIELRKSGERVKFTYAVTRKFAGDECRLSLKRDGTPIEQVVTLSGVSPRFTVQRQLDQPQYVVWCGLVFVQCSASYIEEEFAGENGSIDFDEMPLDMQLAWYRSEKKHADQEVIVLSQVLADELCIGYTHYKNRLVEAVDGQPVNNLRALADALKRVDPTKQPFVRIHLDGNACIVLETNRALQSHPTILERNKIHPAQHLAPPPLPIQQPMSASHPLAKAK
jgi:S1-C subfamily serine protease